ncbi:large ribosomal subunit protein mL64 [Engraulis encrasicolus]|uniref:large ribosomal subunit protein mL64 n=1 Tax=Engraulis encrasicolus TaxID=184585 RepID=UPI002FD5F59E
MAASVLGRRVAFLTDAVSVSLNIFSPKICSRAILLQSSGYHAKPRFNGQEPYIPDKQSARTPEWQKTAKNDRKLFGRYGSSSGIDPSTLWPTPAQLDAIIEDEKQWQASLEEMLHNIAVKDKELDDKLRAREKLIAANMAKMPDMVAKWRLETREAKQKKKAEKAKRDRLLAEAQERFGHHVDPRSSKFQDLLKDMEKEEKKKMKLLKRKKREEEQGILAAATATATSASSGPATS